MATIIDLKAVRMQKRRDYWARHEQQVEDFVDQFIENHFKVSLERVRRSYLADRIAANEMAWDYLDFRDAISQGIHEAFGQQIWQELKATRWFDAKLISYEEIVDRCMSRYLMGSREAFLG